MSRRSPGSILYLLPIAVLCVLAGARTAGTPVSHAARPAVGAVIISEVGWGGTAASSNDEWLELHNTTAADVDLSGWQITGGLSIDLAGTIAAGGFFLLERTDDTVLSDIPADQIFTGPLANSGEALTLLDGVGTTIDTANQAGGAWPAGTAGPDYLSMERAAVDAADSDAGWVSNDAVTRNGLDANGNPVNATPRQPNSAWSTPPPPDETDLALTKIAPAGAIAGTNLVYDLAVANSSAITATAVVLTDTLPAGLTYVGDDSGIVPAQPMPGTLVWSLGTIAAGDSDAFAVTVAVGDGVSGTVTNSATVATATPESALGNNSASAETVITPPVAPGLVINEILADDGDLDANGDGVTSGQDDEFVEIVNYTAAAVDMSGWTLHDATNLRHTFAEGTLLPAGCAVVVFGGGTPTGTFGGSLVQTTASSLSLNNDGDTLTLFDDGGAVAAAHTYGAEANTDQSITRDPDITGAFVGHGGATGAAGALFSAGTRIDGAPFADACLRADVSVTLSGPATAANSSQFNYTLVVSNLGSLAAANVTVTDTLPPGITYVSDTSGWPLTTPTPGTLVWQAGTLAPGAAVTFDVTVMSGAAVNAAVTNAVTVSTDSAESTTANNSADHTTIVGQVVLLNAVHYHGYDGALDEAIELINVGGSAATLSGWTLSKLGGTPRTIPTLTLAAGATAWIGNNADAFYRQFGHAPDWTMAWPDFANTGDEVIVADNTGRQVDTLVYGTGDTSASGWTGAALQAYGGTALAKTGQIAYRMRDQATGLPVPDTNQAADWAQSTTNRIDGRKTRYPGWDLDPFFFTMQATESAEITIAIAPDNAYETIVAEINAATTSIQMELLVITNHKIMEALVAAAGRGVAVDLLLEGTPANRTAIFPQELTLCGQLDAAGGRCWFMINETDGTPKIYDRYDNMHAKFAVFDGDRAAISSENMTGSSLPFDDKSDGTWGRRGVIVITDAPSVVAHLQAVFAADLDLVNHYDPAAQYGDLLPWTANHPVYGNEYGDPGEFELDTESGGITYTVRYPSPATFTGVFAFEIVQSPENSLRTTDGLLGLIRRAGAGDTVLVQQLDERTAWGADPINDASPRMQEYLDAARRGARVRLLLDGYHTTAYPYDPDDPSINPNVCAAVRAIALAERLDLACALGNPAGLGIHNKMVLVEAGGVGYSHVGSINGTETSSKANREIAIQITSNAVYDYLAEVFFRDWPYRQHVPVVASRWDGPADYPLIAEVLYNPIGQVEEDEFIELANPTPLAMDLSGYSLADAMAPTDFADLRRFPAGATLPPSGVLVIAQKAVAFEASFGRLPDYEILESDPTVPNLIDDPAWGSTSTFLRLGNSGDVVILRDPTNRVVDVVAYVDEVVPPSGDFLNQLNAFLAQNGVTACSAVAISGASLERYPYWRDTATCSADFREAVNPSPGELP